MKRPGFRPLALPNAMSHTALLALTTFLFLAIVGGIAGILLEARRVGADGVHNPATRDAMWPIVGWGVMFALYLVIEWIGVANLTPQFKTLLGTLTVLPFYYAVLATLRLIWLSARRIQAFLWRWHTITWHAIPALGRLAFPTLFVAAVCAALTELTYSGLSLSLLLYASIVALLALLQKPINTGSRSAIPPPETA